MYHASKALVPHEIRISGGLKIVALVEGGTDGCRLKSCVTSNTWYAKRFGWNRDVIRRLRESCAWGVSYDHSMVG